MADVRPAGDGGRPAGLRPRTFRPGRRPPRPGHRTSRCSPWSASSTRRGPRPRRPSPSATCAGIQVRMITGDHATTAGAIGKELGIEGRALTGTEFAAMSDEELLAELDEHRRRRPRRARGQDPARPAAQAAEQHRGHDRRRRERRARPQEGRHRRRHGDHRHRGLEGRRGDDPHRRQLRHHRQRRRLRPHPLRQPVEVPPLPDVGPGRLHRDLPRRRHLRHRRRSPVNPLQILWINFVVDIPIAIALGFDQPTGPDVPPAPPGRAPGALPRRTGSGSASKAP